MAVSTATATATMANSSVVLPDTGLGATEDFMEGEDLLMVVVTVEAVVTVGAVVMVGAADNRLNLESARARAFRHRLQISNSSERFRSYP